jgi:hypothetical protein
MNYPTTQDISITTFGHPELPRMLRPDIHGFSEREQRALVDEPLKLTSAQSRRLIRAATCVDAIIWRLELAKLEEQGFTDVTIGKMTPWFLCKAQLVLTTGMAFREVLELTLEELRLSEDETRIEAIGRHKLTDECSALVELVFPFFQLELFPWTDHAHATGLWLCACRDAGL